MEHQENTNIQNFLENYLEAVRIPGKITLSTIAENKVLVKIEADQDSGFLIGKEGSGIESLQYVINVLARKAGTNIHYRVDVNNYQSERDQTFLNRVTSYVQDKAESAEILLWPMSPYERKLVHEYFLEAGTHSTESEDFGSERVIRITKK